MSSIIKLIRPVLRFVSRSKVGFYFVSNPLVRHFAFEAEATVDGLRFHLDLEDYTQRRAWLGCFERDERAFLKAWCRPADSVVDVGANVGLLTVEMARACSDGRVIAVELIAENFSALYRNLELNCLTNVEVVPFACGSRTSVARFGNTHSGPDQSSGFFRQLSRPENAGRGERVSATIPLAQIVDGWDRIRLIKLDIEGGEASALDGLLHCFSPDRVECFLFETVLGWRGYSQRSANLVRRFEEAGYTVFAIRRKGRLTNKIPRKSMRRTAVNLVARKAEQGCSRPPLIQ